MAENIKITLTKNETLTLATERTYAESNIEVTAALEQRSVVANGTYTPGADKVAISSITVNRPADVPTLQDKSITIDGNKPKTVSVVADEGYDALGKVTVITNIQPELEERTVTPTKAQQTIEPSEGKDGFSKVTINAIPAQYIKTADATATAGDMLEGETGYVNSVKVTGTINTYTGDIVTG